FRGRIKGTFLFWSKGDITIVAQQPDKPPEKRNSLLEEMEANFDCQVAVPVELRTPSLHRAKNRSTKRADGRMATEARNHGRREKTGLTLTGPLMEGLESTELVTAPFAAATS